MWLTADKKLCINDADILAARVTDDDGILVSIGASAVTVPPGPDADSLATLLGLDNGAAARKEAEKAAQAKSVHHDSVTTGAAKK